MANQMGRMTDRVDAVSNVYASLNNARIREANPTLQELQQAPRPDQNAPREGFHPLDKRPKWEQLRLRPKRAAEIFSTEDLKSVLKGHKSWNPPCFQIARGNIPILDIPVCHDKLAYLSTNAAYIDYNVVLS